MEQLLYNCPSCDSWYSKDNIPKITGYFNDDTDAYVENNYCDCADESELRNAHEGNFATPYDLLIVEVLDEEIGRVEDTLEALKRKRNHHKGE
jgi:hypothetical protein